MATTYPAYHDLWLKFSGEDEDEIKHGPFLRRNY
jgi:hypothetical protein